MAFLFEFTARQRQSLIASSTARNLAATSLQRCCEKVSIDVNVANKDSGISQEYVAYENWFTPHTLWSREHGFRELADKSNAHTNDSDS